MGKLPKIKINYCQNIDSFNQLSKLLVIIINSQFLYIFSSMLARIGKKK